MVPIVGKRGKALKEGLESVRRKRRGHEFPVMGLDRRDCKRLGGKLIGWTWSQEESGHQRGIEPQIMMSNAEDSPDMVEKR